ncbi:hypothetical protein [Nitrososphaeria virus YSH_1032793]|uniref:Uncharacterized protein n=1 Tax=Nitrososphaeria virus YSH_1032793 TaxID=3071320 RepID=A0A976UAC8_9CAUD|nr:hypothetical protein QKV91_gp18 [Yangshan Harbor Nitrososphaeria virus]UVF62222.1 hypothetical protein [Nitrososphaeria virus YSH_1032793]
MSSTERHPNSFFLPRYSCLNHTREIIDLHKINKETRYNLTVTEDHSEKCQFCMAEGMDVKSHCKLEIVTQ